MSQKPFTSDLFAVGLAATGAGAVAAEAAWLHMRAAAQLGVVCGSVASPHCALCYAGAAALFAGLACLAASAPASRPARAV